MSRQVVSYDDLTSFDASSQATPSDFESANVTKSNNRGSPSSKKRRRDEDDVETGTFGNNEKRVNNGVGDSGASSTSGGNLSSFQTLPPKPQVRKRGRNKRHSAAASSTNVATAAPPRTVLQHWDDPGTQEDGISYNEGTTDVNDAGNDLNESNWEVDESGEGAPDAGVADEDEEEDEEEESRELTHEEIWDDSALIAAWDAANEEYEAIHGKTKRWKRDRVHKSPLWYNIPPEKLTTSSKEGKGKAKRKATGVSPAAEARPYKASGAHDSEVETSVPLNFETFVPTHDPSLAFPNPQHPPPVPESMQNQLRDITSHYSSMLSGPPFQGSDGTPASEYVTSCGAAGVGVDEAFSRALGAMYWCGYWTAVYHVQRVHEQGSALAANFQQDSLNEAQDEDDSELVSTQR